MQLNNKNILQTGAFIDGEWINTGKTFDVLNPFDNTLITKVSDCTTKETKQAIDAADKA